MLREWNAGGRRRTNLLEKWVLARGDKAKVQAALAMDRKSQSMTEKISQWVDEVNHATHAISCAVAEGRWMYDPNLPGKDAKLYHMHIHSKTHLAESTASPSVPKHLETKAPKHVASNFNHYLMQDALPAEASSIRMGKVDDVAEQVVS